MSAVMAQPPRTAWPHYSRNEAVALAQVSQRARAVHVVLSGVPWQVSLEPLTPAAASAWQPAQPAWLVGLRWAGAPLLLTVPAASALAWLQAQAEDVHLPSLDEPTQLPVLMAWLEVALDQLRQPLEGLNRGALTLESLTPLTPVHDSAPALRHAFSLRAQPADATQAAGVELLLRTDSLGLMLVSGAVSAQPAQANGLDIANLPVLLRAEIGRTRISMAEWQAMEVGDALLLDEPWLQINPESGARLRLVAGTGLGGLEVDWVAEGQRLTVASTWTTWEQVMTDGPQADASDTASLDELPVELSFDLGQRQMSLNQLRQLQPGQVIDLARPLGSAVQIRANGALVGQGEVVEIDGRLGVVVARLHTPT